MGRKMDFVNNDDLKYLIYQRASNMQAAVYPAPTNINYGGLPNAAGYQGERLQPTTNEAVVPDFCKIKNLIEDMFQATCELERRMGPA